jgi:hypothetical protein
MPGTARAGREQETRTAVAHHQWKPLDQYPIPVVDGLRFRWLSSVLSDGTPDSRNLSRRFREGWVPTRATDHPELQLRSDERSQFPEGIEISGLLLCQIPQAIVDSRNKYYRDVTEQQMASVDNSMFKLNDRGDHGMHILKPQRRTRISRGRQAESDPESAED